MKDELIKAIGLRLRVARQAAGFKSQEFAKSLGIPLSTYSQHENTKRILTIESLFQYCGKLEIRPAWLLTGEGSPCDDDFEYAHLINGKVAKLIESGEMLAPVTPFIQNGEFANVNIPLLKNIFSVVLPIFKNIDDKHINSQLIEFCFELYNKVVGLDNVEKEEKEFIIKICFESFLSGTSNTVDPSIAAKNVVNF